MNRRDFIRNTSLLASGVMLGSASRAAEAGFPVVRTPEAKRKFKSRAVERTIETIKARIGNKELAWMFENCFPNTLDTTVDFQVVDGRPDTYVITGDIDAMWLRDSTAQVWPYLPLMKNDSNLQQLIAGVINRQTRCILKDPYANAFYKDENKVSEWKSDRTEMKPGVHERKWEIDSLCYPIRLAYHYWKASNDRAPFDAAWREAILRTLKTFREQQRKTGPGPYRFQRRTEVPSRHPGRRRLWPAGQTGRPDLLHVPPQRRRDGLSRSWCRRTSLPSSACARPPRCWTKSIATRNPPTQCRALADEVERALREYAVVIHAEVRAHSALRDRRLRQLLLHRRRQRPQPAVLAVSRRGRPRRPALSQHAPVRPVRQQPLLLHRQSRLRAGRAARGPGHDLAAGLDRARRSPARMTRKCASASCTLQKTHAGTGFMHEAFNKDDPAVHRAVVRLGQHDLRRANP